MRLAGVRVFQRQHDIGLRFRRAWEDADSYYLIGYEPIPHRPWGRFRKVTLKVTRPDLDLRYRRGYFETTEQERVEEDVSMHSTLLRLSTDRALKWRRFQRARRSGIAVQYHRQ